MTTSADPAAAAMTIARAVSSRGEVVLRRRADDGALELRVNGVFVMDTAETASERALGDLAATAASAVRSGRDARVLVGGLGLGYTLGAVLASSHVGSVTVAEIEPAVVAWHRAGLVPATAEATADPRVRIEVGDVRDIVQAQAPGALHVIVLDVDNGPGYLVYDGNAGLYQSDFLVSCKAALSAEGRLLVWSSAESSEFKARLGATFRRVTQIPYAVRLGSRAGTYVVYEAQDA